ncbi:hypothetical protein Esti_003409 [Eimeria stiedai]
MLRLLLQQKPCCCCWRPRSGPPTVTLTSHCKPFWSSSGSGLGTSKRHRGLSCSDGNGSSSSGSSSSCSSSSKCKANSSRVLQKTRYFHSAASRRLPAVGVAAATAEEEDFAAAAAEEAAAAEAAAAAKAAAAAQAAAAAGKAVDLRFVWASAAAESSNWKTLTVCSRLLLLRLQQINRAASAATQQQQQQEQQQQQPAPCSGLSRDLFEDLAACWYLAAALRLPDPALHAALHAAAAAAAAALRVLRQTATAAATAAASTAAPSEATQAAPTSGTKTTTAAAPADAAADFARIGADPLALVLRCMYTSPGSNATDAALQRALQLPAAAVAADNNAAAAAVGPLLLAAHMQQHESLHAELLLGLCFLTQQGEATAAALVNALHACSSSSKGSSNGSSQFMQGSKTRALGLLLKQMKTAEFAAALRISETVDLLQALLQLHQAPMHQADTAAAAAALRAVSSELLQRHRGLQQQQLQQAVGPAAAAAVAAAKEEVAAALFTPPELVLWLTAAAKYGVTDEDVWDFCASQLLLHLQQQLRQQAHQQAQQQAQQQQQERILLPLHLTAAAYACAAALPGFAKPQTLLQRIAFVSRKQLDQFTLPELSQLLGSLARGGVDCRLLLSRCSVLLRKVAAANEDLLQQQQLTGRHLVNLVSAFSRQGSKETKVFALVADLLLSCRDTPASPTPLLRTLQPQDATALLVAFGKARMLHLPLLQELLPLLERQAQGLTTPQALAALKALTRLYHEAPSLQQTLLQQLAYLQEQQQQHQQVLGAPECLILAEAAQRFSLLLPASLRTQMEACLPPEILSKKEIFLGQVLALLTGGESGKKPELSNGLGSEQQQQQQQQQRQQQVQQQQQHQGSGKSARNSTSREATAATAAGAAEQQQQQ